MLLAPARPRHAPWRHNLRNQHIVLHVPADPAAARARPTAAPPAHHVQRGLSARCCVLEPVERPRGHLRFFDDGRKVVNGDGFVSAFELNCGGVRGSLHEATMAMADTGTSDHDGKISLAEFLPSSAGPPGVVQEVAALKAVWIGGAAVVGQTDASDAAEQDALKAVRRPTCRGRRREWRHI